MRRHAFTLVELMVVLAIIAIVAAVILPNILESQEVKPWHNGTRVRCPGGLEGVVLGWQGHPVDAKRVRYTVRIDNGVGTAPRFTVVEFLHAELTLFPEEKP